MTSRPRFSSHGRKLLLVAGAALLVAATTQCRSVTDSITRARVGSLNAGACVSACAHAANEAMKQESKLHVNNVKACGSDPVCKANEEARHEAAVAAIQEQRKLCQNGCHHQGGGKGGR